MVKNEMYNLEKRVLQFKDQEKVKAFITIKFELSLNENTNRPQI